MTDLKITLEVPHLYLEMARAVFTGIYCREKKDIDEIFADSEVDPLAGIIFAATTVTIIYSYLALEAFVNNLLYNIWDISPKVHEKIAKLREENPELRSVLFGYDLFHDKYGQCQEFEGLKSRDLRVLGKRIKLTCKILNIPQIHEVDPQLWQSFKELLEKARHFLVHPYPDQTKFQAITRTIMTERPIGEYAQIAQRIIAYILLAMGRTTPDWLEKNTLFRIKGFDYLQERESSSQETERS
jgi:hypothetical protein